MSDPSSTANARFLLQKIGRDEAFELMPLDGGRNNRVDKLIFQDKSQLILKSYFHSPSDTRDRLGAEFTFLQTAWKRGVRNISQPLACDAGKHVGLYSFIEGEKLSKGGVLKRHVDAAIEFVIAVNAEGPPRDMAAASEACFSMDAHLKTVESRVRRLDQLDPEAPNVEKAASLVENRITPLWEKISRNIAGATASTSRNAPVSEQVASPSDFGFHNALVNAQNVVFLDFEYAGLDDPAKLVCDFFCQPEIPVNGEFFDYFVDQIAKSLSDPDPFRKRANLLLDAYRIKWLCIMLNEFASVGRQRRHFSGGMDDWAQRCSAQLAKANEGVDKLSSSVL